MAHQWEGEFDDRHRYGRPQHERPAEIRDGELYGRPQHPVGEEAERRGRSESPMSLRWVAIE